MRNKALDPFRLTRLVALLTAVLLVAAACGSSAQTTKNPNKDHPRVSFMVPLHQNKAPSQEMLKALEKATQTTLDIEWVPEEVYPERLMNAIETTSLKQVMYVAQSDYVMVKNAIRSGMFWEIGLYLGNYPNLKLLNPTILNETAVDHKIYGLYAERPPSRQGVIIRKDWLDKLQLAAPSTIDELYQVLQQFTNKDPNGNGKPDTIGLADRNDLIYGAFKTLSSYFGTPNGWTLVDGKLVPEFKTQAYADTMNFMKKLYNEKLINTEFSLTSKQQQRYSLITGNAGVYVGNITDATRLQLELKKRNPQAELMLLNRIQGPKGTGIWSMPSFSGVFLFSKKAIPTEEGLKKILALYNRMLEPDVSNMLQYGTLEKHYTVKDGQAVLAPNMTEALTQDVLPWESLIIANLSNPNVLKLNSDEREPLTVEADRLTADNSTMLIRDPTQNLSSATYDSKGSELDQIIADATYNYILGRLDMKGFQHEINNWESRGGTKVTEEYTESMLNSSK